MTVCRGYHSSAASRAKCPDCSEQACLSSGGAWCFVHGHAMPSPRKECPPHCDAAEDGPHVGHVQCCFCQDLFTNEAGGKE